ncbi:uncharacterized protein LOC111245727 isoform X1 [Varroa destructor]|uniref:Uncharacterized protein n=1 Tax=Varroa destructor TaxID=109461 RepID=A0A7M7JRP0_VARDE|nr:uncharacterized protein LOC111245727 isoform X1 [Varroa destructor]
MRNVGYLPFVVTAILMAVTAASRVDHAYNPYREGGYYHFDHQGIPHWHPGRYHYHGYDEYIYRSPKYIKYLSDPVVHQRLPTYTRTYEVPVNYRQVDHQHHHTDDRTIVEKKIYKQEITPVHCHIGPTHIDDSGVHGHVHY